jgi:hypothetical protein
MNNLKILKHNVYGIKIMINIKYHHFILKPNNWYSQNWWKINQSIWFGRCIIIEFCVFRIKSIEIINKKRSRKIKILEKMRVLSYKIKYLII